MDAKLVMVLAALLLLVQRPAEADFMYNRKTPKTQEELDTLGLKCVPGRTVIKIESLVSKSGDVDESKEDEGDVATDARRTHMKYRPNKESCKICVCSVEGKDEYCSRRPARNVNECIRMGVITERFKKNLPYEHERSLSFRIRRDYLWHKDEIPSSMGDYCYRGLSYYTNNDKANDTTLDKQTRVVSQLEYATRNVCYYCVCPTFGTAPGCIRRNPWFCDYYRIIRRPNYARDRYRYLFREDRPAYFRQLSYRIRRTMDDGLQELLQNVGDSINKDTDCVPLVSEYTDCTEANVCSGCSRCTCTADGEWSCKVAHECPGSGDEDLFDEDTISNAYEVLFNELASMENTKAAPASTADGNRILGFYKYVEGEEDKKHWISRVKRSLNQSPNIQDLNDTVRFYHTVDELNEDTLKNTNDSGTIVAKKVEGVKIPKISRRTSSMDSSNITGISDLHIDFNQPRDYDHHIVDNKIDSAVQNEHKINILSQAKISEIIGNYSQSSKDKDLSKLVVNELKKGSETIGNKRVTPVSNITFTPENDTLTAMAFIAGNLLSKLWQIEKDSSAESIETEVLKHEKIADLLELFKEPLTMRQEVFIKNALDKLSKALSKESKVNISLCEALASTESSNNSSNEDITKTDIHCEGEKSKKYQNTGKRKENNTVLAITKINSVLNLLNKYDNVQKHLHLLRNGKQSSSEPNKNSEINSDLNLNEHENKTLNVYGNILEKLAKLILPKTSKRSKQLITEIKHMNLFSNSEDIQKDLKQIININNDNLTLTSKDKLVIDYLNIFKTSDCAIRGHLQKEIHSFPNISGNVVDKLKKLLKIKSLNDLVDLISPKVEIRNKNQSMSRTNEESNTYTAETSSSIKNTEDQMLKTAKDKLKKHLNAILEDLMELRNQSGIALKTGNRSVADVLPCIYNLLNPENEHREETSQTLGPSLLKVRTMFESLKNNFQYGSLSRRSDYDLAETPQSSKVWERIIKNLNKRNTRRTFNGIPKSFEKLKQMIDNVDISSNSYKDYLTLADVPVASHLVLLKVVEASVNQIANTLQNVKLYMETTIKLPNKENFELERFVDNAVQSINLNNKILEKLKAYKNRKILESSKLLRSGKMSINKHFMQSSGLGAMERQTEDSSFAYTLPKEVNANDQILPKLRSHLFKNRDDNSHKTEELLSNKEHSKTLADANVFKLTRDQILNQLIKNRLQLYLQMKEAKRSNLNQDINYNLANTIMNRLENGDNSLGKDLFKTFVENSQVEDMYRLVKDVEGTPSQNAHDMDPARPSLNKLEISRMKLKDYQEDHLLKQLLMTMKL